MVDVFAGNISLTPPWIKKIGCAWLYRFLQEPKKRFKTTIDVLRMGLKLLFYFLIHKNEKDFNKKLITEVI